MSKKPKFTSEDVFALAAELFYNPNSSLRKLSKIFQQSATSIKRMLRFLKQGNIMHGKLGSSSMWLNPVLLPNLLHSCKVVVTIETDVEQLKAMTKDKPQHYDAARELLARLCNELPRKNDYRGRIIVERGYIVICPKSDILMIVCGASNDAIFNFVMHGINTTKGVRSSQTLIVARTVSMAENPVEAEKEK